MQVINTIRYYGQIFLGGALMGSSLFTEDWNMFIERFALGVLIWHASFEAIKGAR